MGTCTLRMGHRVVVRSEGAPPPAELALFDEADLEVEASESGALVEIGYRTTGGEARQRLEDAGVTAALAHEAAEALRGALAPVYARGPLARRVARWLGPAELFDGGVYDPVRDL